MEFMIREMQNFQSFREGDCIEVENLKSAMELAEANQTFEQTVLVIENLCGVRLAGKAWGKPWFKFEYHNDYSV